MEYELVNDINIITIYKVPTYPTICNCKQYNVLKYITIPFKKNKYHSLLISNCIEKL